MTTRSIINLRSLTRWSAQFAINGTALPLDRLAAALFVNSSDPGSRLMALFTAYFDASGAMEQEFVVVSGYLANYFQWQCFEKFWKELHDEYDLALPFHMSDLMAAFSNPLYQKQKNARQDYVKLAKNTDKATDFFAQAAQVQITVINCAITAIVPMDIYREFDAVLQLKEKIPPYALGARMCVDLIFKWMETFDTKESVENIFEDGDFGGGQFSQLMVEEGMDKPIYKKKTAFAGLQAADMYVWERAYFEKKTLPQGLPPRVSFDFLIKAIPKLHIKATREMLLNVCQLKGIKTR